MKYLIIFIVFLLLFLLFAFGGLYLWDYNGLLHNIAVLLITFSAFCLWSSFLFPLGLRVYELRHIHDVYNINIEYSDHSKESYDGWNIDVKKDILTFKNEDGTYVIHFTDGKVNYQKAGKKQNHHE